MTTTANLLHASVHYHNSRMTVHLLRRSMAYNDSHTSVSGLSNRSVQIITYQTCYRLDCGTAKSNSNSSEYSVLCRGFGVDSNLDIFANFDAIPCVVEEDIDCVVLEQTVKGVRVDHIVLYFDDLGARLTVWEQNGVTGGHAVNIGYGFDRR